MRALSPRTACSCSGVLVPPGCEVRATFYLLFGSQISTEAAQWEGADYRRLACLSLCVGVGTTRTHLKAGWELRGKRRAERRGEEEERGREGKGGVVRGKKARQGRKRKGTSQGPPPAIQESPSLSLIQSSRPEGKGKAFWFSRFFSQ